MPIYVPITLRPAQLRDQARGNLTVLMTVPLPVGVPDPGRRLEQIAAQTTRRKAETAPPWARCSTARYPGGPSWRS